MIVRGVRRRPGPAGRGPGMTEPGFIPPMVGLESRLTRASGAEMAPHSTTTGFPLHD
jgi:hypothetical protein